MPNELGMSESGEKRAIRGRCDLCDEPLIRLMGVWHHEVIKSNRGHDAEPIPATQPLPADEEREKAEPVTMHRDIVGEDGIHYKQTTMGDCIAASSEGVKRHRPNNAIGTPGFQELYDSRDEWIEFADHLERENASLSQSLIVAHVEANDWRRRFAESGGNARGRIA